MLNQTGFKKESGTTRKFILVDEKNSTAVSCVVGNTGVDADAEGKKIIKAGTPVTGSLTERNTAFTVDTSAPVGIILHDVDVTAGEANSQVVIFGTIDISKVEEDVATMLTTAASKLKMIQIVK